MRDSALVFQARMPAKPSIERFGTCRYVDSAGSGIVALTIAVLSGIVGWLKVRSSATIFEGRERSLTGCFLHSYFGEADERTQTMTEE